MEIVVTYRIASDGRSITCLVCGRTSWHPEDVRQLYCGYCHQFHTLNSLTKQLVKAAKLAITN